MKTLLYKVAVVHDGNYILHQQWVPEEVFQRNYAAKRYYMRKRKLLGYEGTREVWFKRKSCEGVRSLNHKVHLGDELPVAVIQEKERYCIPVNPEVYKSGDPWAWCRTNLEDPFSLTEDGRFGYWLSTDNENDAFHARLRLS